MMILTLTKGEIDAAIEIIDLEDDMETVEEGDVEVLMADDVVGSDAFAGTDRWSCGLWMASCCIPVYG